MDYLLCSSDPDSLDGLILLEKQIAIVDATAPHVVDPLNPGAVDQIIDLGAYWEEKSLRKQKEAIVLSGEIIKGRFEQAYSYFQAAGALYRQLSRIFQKGLKREELYKNTAAIVYRELAHRELASREGKCKKLFASALTPAGFQNQLQVLAENCRNIYVLETDVGLEGAGLLETFRDSALRRGYDALCFYCPMDPGNKLEHLLIPEISTFFVTSNAYHKIRPAASSLIDLRQYVKPEYYEKARQDILRLQKRIRQLLEEGLECLAAAKAEHDVLEERYTPYMDFDGIDEKRKQVLEEIRRL